MEELAVLKPSMMLLQSLLFHAVASMENP